jgi:hypothetical protein
LPDVVAPCRLGDGQRLRVLLAGPQRRFEGVGPGFELEAVERTARDRSRQGRREQAEPRRSDRAGREQLQHALGGPDEPSGIASQIQHQALLRQSLQQGDHLLQEGVVVLDIEAPDAQVGEVAESPDVHDARGQVVLHAGGQPAALPGLRLPVELGLPQCAGEHQLAGAPDLLADGVGGHET